MKTVTFDENEYVLVPKEPTRQMRHAFHEVNDRFEEGGVESPDDQWRAMIAAAPTPTGGEHG